MNKIHTKFLVFLAFSSLFFSTVYSMQQAQRALANFLAGHYNINQAITSFFSRPTAIQPINPAASRPANNPVENTDCSICLASLNARETVALSCNSKHKFHRDCIETWAQTSNTCPFCRKAIAPNDLTPELPGFKKTRLAGSALTEAVLKGASHYLFYKNMRTSWRHQAANFVTSQLAGLYVAQQYRNYQLRHGNRVPQRSALIDSALPTVINIGFLGVSGYLKENIEHTLRNQTTTLFNFLTAKGLAFVNRDYNYPLYKRAYLENPKNQRLWLGAYAIGALAVGPLVNNQIQKLADYTLDKAASLIGC